jgi:penicillin-binding protein 1A
MQGPSSITRPRGWPRHVRAAATLAGLLVAAYASALAILCHPAIQARLRERIVETLRAQLGGEIVLDGNVRVDPLLRVSFGPLTVRATPDRPVSLHADRVKVRARAGAMLAGRVEPAWVELSSARIVLGQAAQGAAALPGARRGRAGLAGGERSPGKRDELVLRLRGVGVVAVVGGKELELGPLDGHVTRERDDAGERIALDVRLPGGGRAVLDARRGPGDGWRGRARASRVGPELLAPILDGGAAELASGTLSIEAEGVVTPDLTGAEGRVRVIADGIVLAGERIAPTPVGPIHAEAEGTLRWNGRDRHLSVGDGRVSLLGAIRAEAEAEVWLVAGLPASLSLRADALDFGSAVAALPPALAPPPAAPRPAGTLDARVAVAGPLLAPSDWALSAALDLSRMRAASRAAAPVSLRVPFVHRPASGRAEAATVVGPANPDFVPIAELPLHLVRAVTASEDGGFFAHQGFDFGELRNALAENAAAGRAVRGGSTITQQLAKNLYLTGEKTLGRKVREAAITVALEATVPKQRLLEIYLNIVEWAPGVRGIGPAARHWFGKDARELTPTEAAFLASIIPNPTRYHYMRDRGAPSEAWRRRVDDVLVKMAEQGVLGGEALARALAEPVVFTRG